MSNTRIDLNNFFAEVQYKSLKHIELSIGNRDEALDVLQDAMIRLAEKYSQQAEDWPKLFHRIIQNLIRDYHRRKKVRGILVWWQQSGEEMDSEDALSDDFDHAAKAGQAAFSPEKIRNNEQIAQRVEEAVKTLPQRQQQAFWLRALWEQDVAETAFAMSCSEGSVKTHYSRALEKLRSLLGDFDL